MGSPVHLEEFAEIKLSTLVHIILLHDVEELLVAERLPQVFKELLQLGGPCTRGRAGQSDELGFSGSSRKCSSKLLFPRLPTSGAHGVGVLYALGHQAIHTAPQVAHDSCIAPTGIKRVQRVHESIRTQQPIARGVRGAECRLVLLQLAFQ